MNQRRVILREAADHDLRDAIEFYLSEGAQQAALNFIDAVEQSLREIERHPRIGTPRYAHELDLPGLRAWAIRNYPYVVFYVERSDHIDVWRVLHGSRDIPSWLATDK